MSKVPFLLVTGFIVAATVIVFGTIKLSSALLANDKPGVSAHDESDGQNNDDHDPSLNADTSPTVDLTNQPQVNLEIKGYLYSKPDIKIKKGTRVTWTNQDTVDHNVMGEHDHSENAHAAINPSEVSPDILAGPLLAKGESYSHTFNEVGSITYHCSPHPAMKGLITVIE